VDNYAALTNLVERNLYELGYLLIFDEKSIVTNEGLHHMQLISTGSLINNALLLVHREQSISVDSDNSEWRCDARERRVSSPTTAP
jgi:hypothetical protein